MSFTSSVLLHRSPAVPTGGHRSPSSPRLPSPFALETLRDLTDPLEGVVPSFAGALLDLPWDLPERPMRELEPRAFAFRRQPVLHVVDARVRHEHRPAQFQERRRFDDLHVP